MFFQKKSHTTEENVARKSIKKVDTLVTGLILGGIVASIYGVKKIAEKGHHDDTHLHKDSHSNHVEEIHSVKKQGILSRIFFGNK